MKPAQEEKWELVKCPTRHHLTVLYMGHEAQIQNFS